MALPSLAKNDILLHTMATPTLLVILDGFGLRDPKKPGNAITPSTAPNIFGYMKKYPTTQLVAHGKAVGLFKNQEGNSEAGHLNIGAGRIVEQDLVRISNSIDDGTFFKNEAFRQALNHVKKNKSNIHIMGLLTDGQSGHSHPEHLYALLEFFQKQKFDRVYLHLFTDGRDSSPHAAIEFLKELQKKMKNEKIASLMGRFYAMDRSKLWHRTEAAYNAMCLGKGEFETESVEEAITEAYNRSETDEYVAPTVIVHKNTPVGVINDNDAILFFNARSDRARQITKAFVQSDFNELNPGSFKRKKVLHNIKFVEMTDFGPNLPHVLTAFPSPDIDNTLAKVIGEHRHQLYITETEKFAHVTYFINGGFAEPVNGEKRMRIHSSSHYSYALYPQMMAKEITKDVIQSLKKYDFVCVNFPNADMVGHTGNYKATVKAIRIIDALTKKIVEAVLKQNGTVVITADHGNAEEMIDEKTGEMLTEHTDNPVPFILIGKEWKKKKLKKKGKLCDVAPTLLKIMNIRQPKEMTGKALY